MITIKQDLLTSKRNRPALEDSQTYSLRSLKGIVAHWTANEKAGANAKRNRDYFNTTTVNASAHYIVDDGQILQCLPDAEVGFHVGAKNYRPIGEAMREGDLSPNYFLIGFEMCVNSDGNWSKTYKNSVALAAHLLEKYGFTTDQLYRHFDITGKDCPKMMLEDAPWKKFKTDVSKAFSKLKKPIARGQVNHDGLNVRSGAGATFKVLDRLDLNELVPIFETKGDWHRIGEGRWASKKYIDIVFHTKKGRIAEVTGANVRTQPTSDGALIDALPNGSTVSVFSKKDRWLEIGDSRWVHESLVQFENAPAPTPAPTVKKGRVFGTDSLNVRNGPATTFDVVKKLARGHVL